MLRRPARPTTSAQGVTRRVRDRKQRLRWHASSFRREGRTIHLAAALTAWLNLQQEGPEITGGPPPTTGARGAARRPTTTRSRASGRRSRHLGVSVVSGAGRVPVDYRRFPHTAGDRGSHSVQGGAATWSLSRHPVHRPQGAGPRPSVAAARMAALPLGRTCVTRA